MGFGIRKNLVERVEESNAGRRLVWKNCDSMPRDVQACLVDTRKVLHDVVGGFAKRVFGNPEHRPARASVCATPRRTRGCRQRCAPPAAALIDLGRRLTQTSEQVEARARPRPETDCRLNSLLSRPRSAPPRMALSLPCRVAVGRRRPACPIQPRSGDRRKRTACLNWPPQAVAAARHRSSWHSIVVGAPDWSAQDRDAPGRRPAAHRRSTVLPSEPEGLSLEPIAKSPPRRRYSETVKTNSAS